MKEKDHYVKRQVNTLANIGLFYLIIIALFAIPLLGVFVVVLIKGVLDLKYAIMCGGGVLFVVCIAFLIRFSVRLSRKIKQDGLSANSDLKQNMARGEPIQISIFNGLLSLSYGGSGNNNTRALPYKTNQKVVPLIPETAVSSVESHGTINQLKTLSDLKNQDIINEDEFQILKEKLIDSIDDSKKNSPRSDGGLKPKVGRRKLKQQSGPK